MSEALINDLILNMYKHVENLGDYYEKDDNRYLEVGQKVCISDRKLKEPIKCFGIIEEIYVPKVSFCNQPIYVKIAQTHDSDYRISLGKEIIVESKNVESLEEGLSWLCLSAFTNWAAICKEYYYEMNLSEKDSIPFWLCDKKYMAGVR